MLVPGSRKHMEDMATIKVAFQEKTQANANSYLTVQSWLSHSLPPCFLSRYPGRCYELVGR